MLDLCQLCSVPFVAIVDMEGKGQKFTSQELGVLKSLYDSCDADRTGRIHINQLPGLLTKLGKNDGSFLNKKES